MNGSPDLRNWPAWAALENSKAFWITTRSRSSPRASSMPTSESRICPVCSCGIISDLHVLETELDGAAPAVVVGCRRGGQGGAAVPGHGFGVPAETESDGAHPPPAVRHVQAQMVPPHHPGRSHHLEIAHQ